MPLKQARVVVWLVFDELASRVDIRQIYDVEAAGPCLPIGAQRRSAGDHPGSESVHVRPVLLIERGVIGARGRTRGAAVDKEVDAVQTKRRLAAELLRDVQ